MLKLIATATLVVVAPTLALAQSGVQWTRERDATLVSKDVVNERWAITYRVADGRVTGNVFRTDGPPAFVQCNRLAAETFECFGSDAGGEWTSLGQVSLPTSFFLPEDPEPPATLERLLGEWIVTGGYLGGNVLTFDSVDGDRVRGFNVGGSDAQATLAPPPWDYRIAQVRDANSCLVAFVSIEGDTLSGTESLTRRRDDGECSDVATSALEPLTAMRR